MNARKEVTLSERASVSLFECLIVAGEPATGLLYDTSFRDGGRLQITLQLLRDMWQRAETLYIPRADLESLHHMECKSAGHEDTPIPERIATDTRKLARYYIFLLFRYCVSEAGPSACGSGTGSMCNRFANQWGVLRKTTHLLLSDIPVSWLDNKVCSTNYPSAPPVTSNTPNGTPWPPASSEMSRVQQLPAYPNGIPWPPASSETSRVQQLLAYPNAIPWPPASSETSHAQQLEGHQSFYPPKQYDCYQPTTQNQPNKPQEPYHPRLIDKPTRTTLSIHNSKAKIKQNKALQKKKT